MYTVESIQSVCQLDIDHCSRLLHPVQSAGNSDKQRVLDMYSLYPCKKVVTPKKAAGKRQKIHNIKNADFAIRLQRRNLVRNANAFFCQGISIINWPHFCKMDNLR